MKSHSNTNGLLALLIILVVGAVAYLYWISQPVDLALKASGTVESIQVVIAPEVGGRVSEVLVEEGQTVQAGSPLFRLEETVWLAQKNAASASLDTALASLETASTALGTAQAAKASAEAAVEVARLRYESERMAARQENALQRKNAWNEDAPDAFDQPGWYFQKTEELSAAQVEVDKTRRMVDDELETLASLLEHASGSDLAAAETRLAEARAAYRVADDLLERAKNQDDDTLTDEAQRYYEAVEAELVEAQKSFDQMLAAQASEDVLEARTRVAVAQECYETALDRLNSLQTGEDSFRVAIAAAGLAQGETGVKQAEQGILQAEANIRQAEKAAAQAQAQLDLIDAQMQRLEVRAPLAGVVLTRGLEPGEVVQPGTAVLTIGQLDPMSITVYLPEDRYGQVRLGDHAQVTVDSFPGDVFTARVVHISDTAEYTPRNVQTDEGRRTTVYAIRLEVGEDLGKLRPGMPATVLFDEG